jgi:hypothetical protein
MRNKTSLPLVERAAQHWWFYLILTLLFVVPTYTTRPLNPQETPKLVIEVLSHALIYQASFMFPLFKLVPLVVIALLVARPKLFTPVFYAWAALNLLLLAVFQNMADTPTYGFSLLIGNLILYTFTSLLFCWAAFSLKEPLQFEKLPWWRYWVVPLALLAFWFPVNTSLAVPSPDFAPAGLFLNEAGLTACMMLPVYLAVLTLASSGVDSAVLRIAGFIGAITGLLNVTEFFMNASYGWWMGIVHLPLLLISIYAFVLGIRKPFHQALPKRWSVA